MRAGHANEVPLLKRYGWVRDTVRQLDEARRLTHDQGFFARWMSGVVRAQDGSTLTFAIYALGDVSDDTKQAIDTLTTGFFLCGDDLSNQ